MQDSNKTVKTVNGGQGIWDGVSYHEADAQYWTAKQADAGETEGGIYQNFIDYANKMVQFEKTAIFQD
jgi:hypothetical protein|tara:strand:+ start:154 stop:357 length:204 start_codon:yes stop_codon:yes gene_type:complete